MRKLFAALSISIEWLFVMCREFIILTAPIKQWIYTEPEALKLKGKMKEVLVPFSLITVTQNMCGRGQRSAPEQRQPDLWCPLKPRVSHMFSELVPSVFCQKCSSPGLYSVYLNSISNNVEMNEELCFIREFFLFWPLLTQNSIHNHKQICNLN